MATDDTRAAAEKRLWTEVHDLRAGMLGLRDVDKRMQPMTHYADESAKLLHFITASDTELVREVGMGARADFMLQSTDQDFYAALTGTITQSTDSAKLDEIWSTVAAAFFEDGREDRRVTLLEMVLRDAEIWTTTDSSFVFGLEIARATMGDKAAPDIGSHHLIDFVGVA